MKLSDRLHDAADDQPKTEHRVIPFKLLEEAIAFIRAFEGCREKVDCLTRGKIRR